MSTGWVGLAATVLSLFSGTTQADDVPVYINQQKFTIPIRVVPERQHEVRELLLFMSRDKGQTWEIYAKATPDKKGFDFFAAGDGLFYFSIAVIDRSGRQDPADVYRAPVGQKIFIDTTKPKLQLDVNRSGDEVTVAYGIQEDRPERESLKLEYKVGDTPGGQWTPLPIEYNPRGNTRFKPGQPGAVTVRLSLRDLAGNEAVEEKSMMATGMRMDRGVALTGGNDGPPIPNGNSGVPTPPPPTPIDPPPAPAFRPTGGTGNSGGSPLAITQPQQSPQQAAPPPTDDRAFNAVSAGGPSPTRSSLPPLQIVNKRQVKLGFDVTKFGPSGLGSVDVYVTTDEGATWEKSQADPNVTLPVTAETRGGQPVRGNVTVNLPKDGMIYGYCLVVKSRAGLGKEPPRPGDPPQVRIELDTVQPEAELYAPQSDTVRPDCLVLTWKASDRNLAPNPVSIEWSARPDGPWTFIGDAQLANTGRYLWQIAENTPAKVYLKLSVRDTAGNTAIAQTPQPVLIDLTKPQTENVQVLKQ